MGEVATIAMRSKREKSSHSYARTAGSLRIPSSTSSLSLSHSFISDNPPIVCKFIGDTVGKTSLLLTYATGKFPQDFVPRTVSSPFPITYESPDNKTHILHCEDIPAIKVPNERKIDNSYSADIVICCFSVMSPTTYENIEKLYLPLLEKHLPDAPRILVGLQMSDRNDIPITREYGEKLANTIKAKVYLECCSSTKTGLEDLLQNIIKYRVLQPEYNSPLVTSRVRTKRAKEKNCVVM